VLLVALAAPAAPARAGEDDYRVDNAGWNGLADFAALARALHVPLTATAELDLGRLDPARDALLVIYPRAVLPPELVTAFVRGGGRLLVADDFGAADAALAALDVRREPYRARRAGRRHRDRPDLPLAVPGAARHALTDGVDEVVCNHPATLRSAHPALLHLHRELDQVLVAGTLGAGTFVALSDPSVLINAMLAFPGNLALATNLLQELAPPGSGRAYLLVQEFALAGRLPAGPAAGSSTRVVLAFNDFLAGLNELVPDAAALRLAGWASGAALAVLVAAAAGPRRRVRARPFAAPAGAREDA
jgi:hypothetical protein